MVYTGSMVCMLAQEAWHIDIVYDGDTARVVCAETIKDVVQQTGAHVRLTAETTDTLTVSLTGKSDNGSLLISGKSANRLLLRDLNLTNPAGGTIAVLAPTVTEVTLSGKNTIEDGAERDSISADSQRACLTTADAAIISGDGRLNVTANYKHGIYSAKRIEIRDATINVKSAKTDGIRGKKKVTIANAKIDITKANKHGINSDDASVDITDSDIKITVKKAGAKGISATKDLSVTGGKCEFTLSANASKALKSDADIRLTDMTLTAKATGGLDITGEDKTYCSIIKADGNLTLKGVTADITHEGEGGKGFCCDSTMTLKNSQIDMQMTGNGAPYLVNMGMDLDYFTPRCLESKTDMEIISGRYTLHASGTGGKGIVCDSILTIGKPGAPNDQLIIDITTEGTVVVDDYYEDKRYGCPKAIKSGKEIHVNSGTILSSTCGMGGEGMESKGYLTVNGGIIVSEAYDDGINVEQGIIINGGTIYCTSVNNDGIDSNGYIELNGGTVASLTSHEMDEDFDCDDDRFYLNGGTIMGVGRDYSGIYLVNQPYTHHLSVLQDKLKGVTDSIASHDFAKGGYAAFADAEGRVYLTALVHDAIPAAFLTISAPGMQPGDEVYVYELDNVPTDAETLIEGRLWAGGTVSADTPALYSDAATTLPYEDPIRIEHTIGLKRGWNLISANIIGGVSLSDFGDQLIRIKRGAEESVFDHYTGRYVGEIDKIDSHSAYMVEMLDDLELTVAGRSLPRAMAYRLTEGWNWISYNGTAEQPLADAIDSKYLSEGDYIADHHDWAVYTNGQWVGPLRSLLPGRGYKLRTATPKILRYN